MENSSKAKKHEKKKDDLPVLEPFHAKNPVFTSDPIPENLKFPLFDRYIIPMRYELGPDPGYITNKLVPHFESVVNSLSPIISQLENSVNNLEAVMDNISTQTFPRYKYNYFTQNLWQRFNVLYPLYVEIKANVLASRYSIQSQRLELLTQIVNVAKYLAEHPGYYYINHVHAEQTWRSIEFNYISSVYLQFKVLKLALKDIEITLKFIPHPFINVEETREFLRNLVINQGCGIADPITGYIPHCKCYEMFSVFMDSRRSPVHFSKKDKPQNKQFDRYLNYMVEKLMEFGNFEKNSKESKVIEQLSIRYLFDLYPFIENDSIDGFKVDSLLAEFNSYTMGEIIHPYTIFEEDSLSKSARDFFTQNHITGTVVSDIQSVVFENNPFDIAHRVFRVSLTLNYLLTTYLHLSIEEVNNSQEMNRVWGALLVACDMPGICSAFLKIQNLAHSVTMPKEFLAAISLPLAFINTKLYKK